MKVPYGGAGPDDCILSHLVCLSNLPTLRLTRIKSSCSTYLIPRMTSCYCAEQAGQPSDVVMMKALTDFLSRRHVGYEKEISAYSMSEMNRR